jgi:hypothetical protein
MRRVTAGRMGGKKKSPFLMAEERGFSGWLLLLDLNQQPFD